MPGFLLMFDLVHLQVGQEIEVRPGNVSKDQEGKLTCKPIYSRILSLFAEQNDLQYAVPGGLIGEYCWMINTCISTSFKFYDLEKQIKLETFETFLRIVFLQISVDEATIKELLPISCKMHSHPDLLRYDFGS